MKNINITFNDLEYKLLKNKKKNLTWHDFIMTLAKDETKKGGK